MELDMTAITRAALYAAISVLTAACASRPAPAPIAFEQIPGDAGTLRMRCNRLATEARMPCYDAGLLATMRAQGINTAMHVLDSLGAVDEAIKRDGHMYAHSLGLAAYTNPAELSATFRQCLPSFQSGCYHGVIQAYFSELTRSAGPAGLTNEAVDNLCKDYRGANDAAFLLFQCVHGMGHGISQVSGHDIRKTLEGCDKLSNGWEREGCYGGAFMENAMQAFSPHHAVGRPDAGADHTKMDHSKMEGMDHGTPPPNVKLVDPADPLYPCSVLDKRYLTSCYMAQTSVMLNFNRGDFADAARSCDKIDTEFRPVCYQSLGRDASSYTLQDIKRAAAICSSSGDRQYQPWCHNGFVKNVIDITADHRSGLPYCRSLTDADATAMCYRAIGEQISVLKASTADRTAACGDVDVPFREICLQSAGVRPKGSP